MSQRDWQLLQMRRSCNLLTREEMERGKTPTTPTISSIIAGVQCQEAVKLLHGLPTIAGKGWVFDGLSTEAYQTEYQRKADCESHDAVNEIVALSEPSDAMSWQSLLDRARRDCGDNVTLELGRDVLHKLVCPKCRSTEVMFCSLGKVKASQGRCGRCSGAREVVTFNQVRGNAEFLDRTLSASGVPPFDIVVARSSTRVIGYEFAADRERVLGPLSEGELELL